MKRFLNTGRIYPLLLAASFGWLASLLQQLVLAGKWHSWSVFFGEWAFASIYFYVLWRFILFLLKRLPPILHSGALRINNIFWGWFIAAVSGIVWLFVLGILMEILLTGGWDYNVKPGDQLRFIILYYELLIGLNYLTICAYQILKQFTVVRNAHVRSEKAVMEAQLQMLRSQLNPHFLFNSLNIIASTIKGNPTVAYDFTKNMAGFYRKILESDNVGWVLLREEMKIIGYYLNMLTIRFEDKLIINLAVDNVALDEFLVPEFILQPIVENIIKHNECSRARPLHITVEVIEDGVLQVKNNVQLKDTKQDSLGIGWFNIESRYKYLGAESPVKFEEHGWFFVRIPMAKAYQTKSS